MRVLANVNNGEFAVSSDIYPMRAYVPVLAARCASV